MNSEGFARTPPPSTLLYRIEAAQYEVVRDRARGLERLNKLFREGVFPQTPVNGPTNGQMIAADIAPHVTPPFVRLIETTKPWLGKVFDAEGACGENLLTPGFVNAARVFFPGYSGFRPASEHSFTGFSFRTYAGDGVKDPDRRVLKIDYDSPVNPPAMRRILDELVQLDDNYYLGKAHFRLSLTNWHLLFYFALQRC
ncbi:MAG: hypothetical protein Q8P41_13140 [Pseudomonadota bacterium]|nr:hypothetical protein [Pseudomonadota bacterium]